MYELKMCQRIIILLLFVSCTSSHLFDLNKLKSYMKVFDVKDLYTNDTGNSLWQGLFKDCTKKESFSCIQKNVYTYLDDTFTDRDNITVFDGFVMTKNDLNYQKYSAEYNEVYNGKNENHIEDDIHVDVNDESSTEKEDEAENLKSKSETSRNIEDNYVEPLSPLEEVTNAIHDKAIKFLATRDYEVQLPTFFFEGTAIKLSPKEIDEDGALIRVDFKHRALATEGRLFKKLRKLIKNKLVTSFLALLLIIKLIKIKFMFIIPFLFGVGTAKKLFLKLLLFLVPAFAHVFKLCSSYYSSGTKYHHHHHHQTAHHHHHVPVPVPIPSYHHDHHDHHPQHHEEEVFEGYDYPQPHIQHRKDIEELKEWGIDIYEDPGVVSQGPYTPVELAPGPYGMPQYAVNARPVTMTPNHLGPFEKYMPQIKYDKPLGPYNNPKPNIRHTFNNIGMNQFNKNLVSKVTPANLGPIGNHAHNSAYNGYLDDMRYSRGSPPVTEPNMLKGPFYQPQQQHVYSSQNRPTFSKHAVFAPKSDNVENHISGPGIAENILRTQQFVKPAMNTPVYVQSNQLGNSVAQNFGQAVPNVIQQSQTLSAGSQNAVKPLQPSPNGLSNSQQKFPLNPSSIVQQPTYNSHTSPQSLHHIKTTSGSTAGIEIVKTDLQKNLDTSKNHGKGYDDEFYGPILGRLEEIFKQLRFVDEECRNRLVCSMYKNPTIYAPHSNLVSNELSREADELRYGNRDSDSGRRFQRYLNAARAGQDRGDCLRLYSCHMSTE